MITYNNIVQRFKEFADNHFFIQTFTHGSPEDVDLTKFTEFPLMHLVYTGATYDDGSKTYNLEVYILDLPNDKQGKVEPQREAVSDAEQCAEDIIADVKNGGNIFLFAEDYEVVNATTSPLEEANSNVLSGVLLDLSVQIPYQWDSCNAPIDGVTAGGSEIQYARRGVLRVKTIDGTVDVLSVQTIKVTDGTLTDNGSGTITLDTGGGGAEVLNDLQDVFISAPQDTGQTLVYDRDATPRGWHNQKNLLANLGDTNITSTPSNQAFLRYVNGAWEAVPVAIPSPPPDDTDQLSEGNTNLYHTDARVAASPTVAANTAKVGITAEQADAIVANTAKVGITTQQANDITANNAKVGITTQQATEITLNSAKTSYPSADATKLAGIEDGAEVNVQADWNATTGDALILNKPTVPEEFADLAGNADDIPEGQTNKFLTSVERAKLTGIATGAEVNVNADWNAGSGDAQILNKPTLATVATSGSYADLSNTPSIPSAIGDLSDVPASLGTSGQVLAVNAGGTALEYVAQSGGGGGVTLDYARMRMSSAVLQGGASQQSFDSSTDVTVKFDTEEDVTGTGLTTNTIWNRITIGTTGYYRLTVNMSFYSGATRATPIVRFNVNGSTILGGSLGYIRATSGSNEASGNLTRVIELNANDYIEVCCHDESTSSGAIYATEAIFEVESVGGAAGATGSQGPSGTSYDVTTIITSTTLSSLHTTKYLVCNSASAMNLTVPASASYDTYAEFVIEQRGAGQVTVVADTGVTIHSTETLKSGAQYAVMGLKRTDTNTYVLTGEREAAP